VNSPIESLRRLLLVLLAFGMIGTAADLLLLDHYESGWQLAPLVLIAVGLVMVVWLFLNDGFIAVTAMRAIMACFIVAGITGVVLHYNGNREFQHELDPTLAGWALVTKVMKAKAPPALAPASMIQLGLLGLLYTYRHPSLRSISMKTLKAFVLVLLMTGSAAQAQVGKSLGVVDANTVAEKELLTFPHMNAQRAKGLIEKRPFASSTDLNAFLLGQGLTQDQANEFYGKAFVHINLNTATPEEILLVPGAGKRMVREFAEYRPWKSYAHFDKEIGKYVGAERTAQLAQYTFIPVRLNTATDEDILSIPGAGKRMVHEFKEYRPWKTKEQFLKEIGKYVGAKDAERMWRYVVID
jgi:DNA uptake protein ComE-like DNA-binding protein